MASGMHLTVNPLICIDLNLSYLVSPVLLHEPSKVHREGKQHTLWRIDQSADSFADSGIARKDCSINFVLGGLTVGV